MLLRKTYFIKYSLGSVPGAHLIEIITAVSDSDGINHSLASHLFVVRITSTTIITATMTNVTATAPITSSEYGSAARVVMEITVVFADCVGGGEVSAVI